MNIQPTSLWHLVRLLDTRRELPSGIVLPDEWWTNWSTGLVLASGPGLWLEGGVTVPPIAAPGDLILFSSGDFHALAEDDRQGFVYDLRVAGWVWCDPQDDVRDRVLPANDFVLVRLDERPRMAGRIHLPERQRRMKRRRRGTVMGVGPGRLIATGRHRGTRLSVEAILGRDVMGRSVWWSDDADAMCVGRTALEFILARAGDLVAVEEE